MDFSNLFARDIHPAIACLARHACAAAGDAPMPYRSRLQAQHIADILGEIFLIDVLAAENDYYFGVFGRKVAKLYGTDLLGKRLSEIGDAALRRNLRITYDRVVDSHLPLYMRGRYVWPDASITIERLLLPMADDDDQLTAICGISRPLDVSYDDLDGRVGSGLAQLVGDDELILAAA